MTIQTSLFFSLLFTFVMPAVAQAPSAINPATGNAAALQLHDIHLPEQVSNMPTAMGWWLSIITVIVLLIVLVGKLNQYKALRKNQQRVIKEIEQQMSAGSLTMEKAMSLVKWSAMQYFPRDNIAALYQASFKNFLVAQLPSEHQASFSELASDSFNDLYKADFAHSINTSFNQAVLLWVKKALPPKTTAVKVNLGATSSSVKEQS